MCLSVHVGLVDDVLIVPVSISYDRILERTFVKEELMVSVNSVTSFRLRLQGCVFPVNTSVIIADGTGMVTVMVHDSLPVMG